MHRFDMVSTLRRLAIEAGRAIMDVYERDEFAVTEKADQSPVTEADLLADGIISDGLRAGWPDLTLVTEEQAATHDLNANTFLIVDPLDGTKEFVNRRGDFTVNIALVENGTPTLGVVYAPAKGRLFLTLADGGAVEETGALDPETMGETRAICVRRPDNSALFVVASKSHRSPELEDYIGRYSVADSVAAGSSLKFCLVAAGEADFYPRLGPTMEWDTAAGHAVLNAAGGTVLNRDDHTPLAYGKPGFRNPHFLALAPGVDLVAE
ncbi:3'(2'),5'-bisphosphate nucleotidase CysQ [Alphaproteobacteria bacterium GH1-50]|uniref:3'(2'),5'-bisphosphate nucleotidase CysQ n=1 Tax=Kangsaoukella pontilimi TaxID=2691042 RepID=A0A7C9IGE8_9RHOB|nr:3'(2'),5'-bisphosphate nucleotidase CysQ [Kangsaoukella pontilimi]